MNDRTVNLVALILGGGALAAGVVVIAVTMIRG